jgi:hypothetical protein
MNWDAIGAMAELAGAAAVVASLVYLATQIKQSSRVARAQAQDAAAQSFRQVTGAIMADPELNRLLVKAVDDWRDLPTEERARTWHMLFQLFKAAESIHHHYETGLLDEGSWDGWQHLLTHYFTSPGLQTYWSIRREAFAPGFRSWVDSLTPPERRVTGGDLGVEHRPKNRDEAF